MLLGRSAKGFEAAKIAAFTLRDMASQGLMAAKVAAFEWCTCVIDHIIVSLQLLCMSGLDVLQKPTQAG